MGGYDHFRAHARHGVDLWALACCPDAGWQGNCRLLNLALGGCCIETGDFLAPGLAIELALQAPTLWDPLVLPATVSWCSAADSGFQAGLRFDHAEPGSLMALFDLLGALLRPSFSDDLRAAPPRA